MPTGQWVVVFVVFLTRKHFTHEFKRRKNVIELGCPLTTLKQQKHFSTSIPSPQKTGPGNQRAMYSVNSHHTFLKTVSSALRVAIICFIKKVKSV